MLPFRWSLLYLPLLVDLVLCGLYLIACALVSGWISLAHERVFFSQLILLAKDPGVSLQSDDTIRQKIQGLARENKLDLNFEDIWITYTALDGVETPTRIGYAVPIEVNVFSTWSIPILTIRAIPLCLPPQQKIHQQRLANGVNPC